MYHVDNLPTRVCFWRKINNMDYRLLSNNNNNTYPTHHHWFPKMCSCVGNTGSYVPNTRNHRSTNFFHEFNQMMRHPDHLSIDSERNAIIKFHNSDTEPSVLTVEKDLRIIDLCELLKVKHRKHGSRWTIIEKWIDIGIERTLEDHEDILEVYKEGEMLLPIHGRRFDFDVNHNRYEYFEKSENYFPPEMVASGEERINSFMTTVENALRVCVSRIDEELPKICSEAWVLNKNTNGYVKCRLLLEDRKLYTMPLTDSSLCKYSSLDCDQAIPFAHLSDYYIYKIPNAKDYFKAPFYWGACLRPASNAEAEDTETGESGLKVIAFDEDKTQNCWLTAMRLAKYGKQLKDNYRAFKNKSESTSAKEQCRVYNASNDSFRSRVAMDFTGSTGRIVTDPKEARAIAESEGQAWRQSWRPSSRLRPNLLPSVNDNIHASKPWFHKTVNRDRAAALVKAHSKSNGVFLVRESWSYPGAFVLTYKYSGRIFHAQIRPAPDESGNGYFYSLDQETKFYDLVQLVEFYQLNAGSLPTKLTQYVDNGLSPSSSKMSSASTSASPSSTKQSISPRKIDNGPKSSRS